MSYTCIIHVMIKMQIKYLLDRIIDIQNDPLVGVVI